MSPASRTFIQVSLGDIARIRHELRACLEDEKSVLTVMVSSGVFVHALQHDVEIARRLDGLQGGRARCPRDGTPMPLTAGSRLGPYEITELLGAGGMGEVYKARDTRLDRDVAIKVIGSLLAGDATMRQRMLREARAASSLNHPHICTVHDVGDEGGRPFIAMEWIDGESLAQRLERAAGPLLTDDVIRLGAQVADALDAAHRSGIVHRDLKPANLFVTRRGDAKILDFGLAKTMNAGSAAGPAGDVTVASQRDLSCAGEVLGTFAYMAPEQARGERVDARSDLFSLGVVLYEMATGRQAFAGKTAALTFDAILNRQPAEPREINDRVPPGLNDVIGRLLAKDPAARPASAGALKDELDRIQRSDRPSGPSGIVPSLAVLPFTNLSPEAENEYIADGITEEVLNTLARIPGLQVAARTSSFAFKGKTPDVAEVGAKLHVAHVLTGSVRKAGPRLRITVQLVSTRDSFSIWSERYDRQTDDIFQIQDEIAAAIAEKLRITLAGSGDGSRVKRATDNLAAYELFLKGRFFLNQRGAGMLRGLECFEQALAIDSHYAPAHAGVAMATMLLSFYAYIPAYEGMPRARRSAQRALGIDPAIADAHAALMFVQWCYDWDWEGAERSFRRCVETDPRFVPAYVFHGAHMAFAHGRHEDASAACLRALEIDPLSALVFMAYANACVAGERYQDAVGYAGRGIEIEPQMWIVHRALAAALRMLGRLDESLAAAEQSMALSNRHAWPMQEAIETLLTMRRVDDAHRLAREVLERERAGQPYVSPIAASFAHGVLGHRDESVAWMERAYREHDAIPIWNYWPSTLAGVDGRSVSLLSRVGLKPRPGFGTKA